MRVRSLVVSGLLAGTMAVATSVGASANFAFCESDPPVLVVTPGGNTLQVNDQVYLAHDSQQLLQEVTATASVRSDGRGGTLITVSVYVPTTAHVVASVNRYRVSAAADGSGLVTLVLDVPIS